MTGETQAIAKNGEADASVVSGVPFEQDTIRLAKAMTQSGFFKDAGGVAQAVVKILAGRELGFAPVASMTGVYIVDGKVTISANLMAAAIKRSGRYNYRVRELTNEACRIEFFEGKESIGVSDFTITDATAAGLAGKGTWQKYPRNLLFARAMSNGARFHCADVFGGPTYTPEELGADVGEDGVPLDVGSNGATTPGMAAQTPAAGPSPVGNDVTPLEGEFKESEPDDAEPAVSTGEDIPEDQAEEVARLMDQAPESPVRGACRSVFSRMQRFTLFERVKLPADAAPDAEWNTWHDSWLMKVEEAERAAERRGQRAAGPAR